MTLSKSRNKFKRLKGKAKIEFLFKKGMICQNKDLLMRINIDESFSSLEVGFSVSKKNFSRAVDRNLIKRLMRESLKKIEKEFCLTGTCIVLYAGKKLPARGVLKEHVRELFDKVKP